MISYLIFKNYQVINTRHINQMRTVSLGDHITQSVGNIVFTAKYTLLTFIPKSLFFQFLRLSNIVFLANAILQSIPIISSLSPITAIAPLCFVLIVSLTREAYEDCKRHAKDAQINSRKTIVLRSQIFQEIQWRQVRVGDFVKVRNGQIVPCDILLLYSSEENSMCYIQTANLDGENNLKEKFAFTENIRVFPEEFESLRGECIVQPPKPNLHEFDGTIAVGDNQPQYIGPHNLLLRETTLRNTDQVVGVALYCGYDTKILKNQGLVHHKLSQIQHKLNYIQIGLLILLGLTCGSCSVGYYVIHSNNNLRSPGSYIPLQNLSLSAQSGLDFLTVFLLLNFLIPISLVILIQAIKAFSGVFLSIDKKMYDGETKSNCGVLNSSIIQQLGVIDCILTDKTGTLTANQMVFQNIAIEDTVYTRNYIEDNIQQLTTNPHIRQFFLSMVICHEVVKDQLKGQYQGSSPDQVCFINFAKTIGYQFVKRTKTHIQIKIQNQKIIYELIDIISFSSRKRMTVIVKDINQNNQVIIFTKGADSQIFQKSSKYQYFDSIFNHLNSFAKQGLRTLVFSKRTVSQIYLQSINDRKIQLKTKMVQKIISKQEYNQEMNAITQEIQSDLNILGVSGIEDKLQEQVPETIERLQRAGIIVMMITGDKLETAENIGYLAKLIKHDYKVIRIASDIVNLHQECEKISQQLNSSNNSISIIIEGKQISKIIQQKEQKYIEMYRQILQKAKSVIFCRSSPKEKAEIVKFVKYNMKAIVLAIGDGGNDVGMIEQAQIGVGIIGKEGNSAAAVSDFSFAKFKFLDRLVLHHGRWFYYRLSYFFIYYGWKNTIITFVMYFTNIFNTFSGIINYTQGYYTLYNSFFVVAQSIYFGLYEQDINDDLQPQIITFLPEIYKQTKKKQLFSFKRYILWTISGFLIALIIYQIIINSLSPLYAANQQGMVSDQNTERITNGIVLVVIVMLVNYIDTQSHTLLFQIIIFLIGSVILTAIYFIAENQLTLLGYYQCYTDNMNIRFWLTIFVIVMMVILFKIAIISYSFDKNPSIIDRYKLSRKYQIQLPDNEIPIDVQNQIKTPRNNRSKLPSLNFRLQDEFAEKEGNDTDHWNKLYLQSNQKISHRMKGNFEDISNYRLNKSQTGHQIGKITSIEVKLKSER